MTEPVTLEFLARQQEHILSELVRMRTELTDVRGTFSDVLTAMAMRHENTMKAVLAELQAINQSNARAHDTALSRGDVGT
jgi:hypothetical protein